MSLAVHPGEVVGLIGENGAGKSTLMKILGGVVAPSAGTIAIRGTEHEALTVTESLGAGIAFVHQELNLFDNLDAAANVFIGREPTRGGPLRLVDRAALRSRVEPLLTRLGCDFAADTPVSALSIAQCQMLEIVKALSLDARLIIMDEPTSSLTLTETNRLLAVVADLRRDGVAIVFISHRLSEVEACADRVVVLRDGALVGTLARGEIAHDAMIRLMIGRDLKSLYTPPARPPGDAVLDLVALSTSAYPDRPVTLPLRGGEILGLGGLIGAGRTELARAIFGIDRPAAGTLRMAGEDLRFASPRDAISRGIYLAPEDRKASGLILDDPIVSNVSLASLARFARAGLVDTAAERANAETQRQSLRIKAPDVATPHGLALRRQPAEGRARQVALHGAEGDDLRRADAGDRRRFEGRGLRADAGPRRSRRRHPDDLERHGGGDRGVGPGRRDARGRRNGRSRTRGPERGGRDAARRRRHPALKFDTAPTLRTTRDAEEGPRAFPADPWRWARSWRCSTPRFISPVNISNTANLIGLYGLFSIGEGFVIITGGIDLSIGSVFALLGVVFISLVTSYGLNWVVAVLIVTVAGVAIGVLHGFLITRMRLQPFVVTLCGLLIYRGVARYYTDDGTAGFGLRPELPHPRLADDGAGRRRADELRGLRAGGARHGRAAAPIGLRPLPLRRRQERGGGALFGHRHAGGDRRRLCDLFGSGGDLVDLFRHVHALDLAGLARHLLRALRHRSGGAGRLLAPRGGEGSILGIALGAVLLQILQNLVNLLGIPSSLNFAVMGGVILAGVLMDGQLQRFRARRVGRGGGGAAPAAVVGPPKVQLGHDG